MKALSLLVSLGGFFLWFSLTPKWRTKKSTARVNVRTCSSHTNYLELGNWAYSEIFIGFSTSKICYKTLIQQRKASSDMIHSHVDRRGDQPIIPTTITLWLSAIVRGGFSCVGCNEEWLELRSQRYLPRTREMWRFCEWLCDHHVQPSHIVIFIGEANY